MGSWCHSSSWPSFPINLLFEASGFPAVAAHILGSLVTCKDASRLVLSFSQGLALFWPADCLFLGCSHHPLDSLQVWNRVWAAVSCHCGLLRHTHSRCPARTRVPRHLVCFRQPLSHLYRQTLTSLPALFKPEALIAANCTPFPTHFIQTSNLVRHILVGSQTFSGKLLELFVRQTCCFCRVTSYRRLPANS